MTAFARLTFPPQKSGRAAQLIRLGETAGIEKRWPFYIKGVWRMQIQPLSV
ncbi:hypothetical protein [Cohnella caldifontis]|uniref:hypothetical protein n=1 Tax=Cohnella caldifontis TaxID=3027471 RepID=UPI0023ECA2E7|nr:hypothetical protein [Cohnella sp. YIM B05605]